MTGKLKKQGKANRRTPRRRPQPRGQGFGMKSALLGSVAVTLAFGAAGGFGLYHHNNTERPDELGCYERPNQAELAVFVDASLGGQGEAQIRDYREGIRRAYERAPPNTRVMFFSTARGDQQTVLTPVFEICKPTATQAEQASLGAPTHPPQYLARRSNEVEQTVLTEIDDLIMTAMDADQRALDSPILEQVRELSRYPDFQGDDREMVLITDFVQNSDFARFCRQRGDLPSFERFKERPDYPEVQPRSLAGAEVTILLVETIQLPQPGMDFCTNFELRAFARSFVLGNGAEAVDLTPLRFWGSS